MSNPRSEALSPDPQQLRAREVGGPWEPGPRIDPPSALPSLALALVTLAGVGISLMLFGICLALSPTDRADFLVRNVLGADLRKAMLLTLAGGAIMPIGVAGAVRLLRRQDSWLQTVASIDTLATLLAPLSLAFVVPLLFIWQFAQAKTTYYLILLATFTFVSRALLTRSLTRAFQLEVPEWLRKPQALRVSHTTAFVTVALAACGYAAFIGYYSVQRHHLIQSTAFDLGIYDNLLFNSKEGRYFTSPVLFGPGQFNYIAGHAEYAMLLFAPLYALWPRAETLLWMQSILLGGAAIPLFMFARRFLSPGPSMIVGLAYLLFAPLHGPNFYDFHWLPIATFFHFWLYYALAARKNWLAIPTILVLYAIREDIALGLVLLGAFLFLTGARVRFGIVLSIVSALWFAVNKFIIMPWAGTWWFENIYVELFADGNKSYGSVLVTLLSNPGFTLTTLLRGNKLAYGLHMLAPLAFIPLRRPALLLLLIPGFFFSLLTTAYAPTLSIAFQYTAHWIPYLFLALVLGLWLFARETDAKPKLYAALITIVIALCSHSNNFGAILQQESVTGGFGKIHFDPMTEPQRARYAALQEILKLIPPNASVAAGEYMNPHISNRKNAYVFRYKVGPVDYVFFSKLELNSGMRRSINEQFRIHKYRLVASTGDEFYLFKRGGDSIETQKALKKLGLTARLPKK